MALIRKNKTISEGACDVPHASGALWSQPAKIDDMPIS